MRSEASGGLRWQVVESEAVVTEHSVRTLLCSLCGEDWSQDTPETGSGQGRAGLGGGSVGVVGKSKGRWERLVEEAPLDGGKGREAQPP